MMRSFFELAWQMVTGLRFRLLLLVLITSAPLAAVTIHTAWVDRQRDMRDWRVRASRLVQINQHEEQRLTDATRQVLLAASEAGAVKSLDPEGAKRVLTDILGTASRYCDLGVVLTNGDLLTSVALKGPQNFGKAAFFRRAINLHGLSTGDFTLDRTTGKPVVRFGSPVMDRSNRVVAVAYAELDLRWHGKFESELPAHLPNAATWTEVDRKGRILARYPRSEQWVGRIMRETNLVHLAFAATNNAAAGQRKGNLYYGFASGNSQLTAGGVAGILGIHTDVLFAEANRALTRNLTALGIAAGVALIFGWLGSRWLVLGPVRTLARVTARLADGNPAPQLRLRPHRDELGQLARSFLRLAGVLEDRESQSRNAHEKLQVLSSRLVQAQESERRHIARELHDEIGQSLTAAELNLQAALQSRESAVLERRLKASIVAVERVLEQVHDMSLNLRPSMLDDLGLEPALRWYVRRQADLAQLEAGFQGANLEARLDPVVETECFRVAQEALTNVVRHAQAKSVQVRLEVVAEQLHLTVRDDGVGFNPRDLREEAVNGASLGLLSMEERASLAGGGLEFISAPGEGAEIHAWFPLKWKKNENWSELHE